MAILKANVEHSDLTTTSKYRYLFTEKHHGGPSSANQAQWLPEMELRAEFWVFAQADQLAIADENGNLYGLLKEPNSSSAIIGTRDELVAKFPQPTTGNPWHGYVLPQSNLENRSVRVSITCTEVSHEQAASSFRRS